MFTTLTDFFLEQPYLASAIIGLLLLLCYEAYDRYNDSDDEPSTSKLPRPPRVKYLLPWIGSALEMGKDPDGFFKRASADLGPVFQVKSFGQDLTYVTSPDLISAIYRDAKTFDFLPIRLSVTEKIFGVSHAATYSSFTTDQYLAMHHVEFSQKRVAGLVRRYAKYAHECVSKALDKFDGTTTQLIPFLIPPAYSSAAFTLFGRSFDAEKSFKTFQAFDGYFHMLLAGMPRFILPGPYRALDQLTKMYEQYLQSPHEDCSEFVSQVESAAREAGLSLRDIARFMFSELWALEANAVWAAYWTLALSLQKPQGLAALISEVDQARMNWEAKHLDEKLETNLPQLFMDEPLPLTTSAIQEALRLSTSTFSIRRVSRPVDFAGYHFGTDERIVCATRSVHLYAEIHPNAHEFVADRYMNDQKLSKNGKAVPNHSMPFGGGVSMCEGRHFAMGELKILLATILTYVTIELDPTSTTKPTHYLQRIGAGLMPPVGDLNVKISRRNL